MLKFPKEKIKVASLQELQAFIKKLDQQTALAEKEFYNNARVKEILASDAQDMKLDRQDKVNFLLNQISIHKQKNIPNRKFKTIEDAVVVIKENQALKAELQSELEKRKPAVSLPKIGTKG